MAGWIAAGVILVIAGIVIWNMKRERGTPAQTRTPVSTVTPARAATSVNTGTTPAQTQVVPLSRRNETGPMVYYANDAHGSSDKEYRFNYKKVNGSWRAYILKMPDFRGRDGNSSITHRLWDNGSPYICWNSAVNSLKDMQTISRIWADNIQEYIATGKTFGPRSM